MTYYVSTGDSYVDIKMEPDNDDVTEYMTTGVFCVYLSPYQ